MVTQAVVDACGLVPIGFREILHVQGKSRVEIFLINIKLPNEIVFSGVSVAKGSLGPGADVLIGMDIINEGDFAVTNLERQDEVLVSRSVPNRHRLRKGVRRLRWAAIGLDEYGFTQG